MIDPNEHIGVIQRYICQDFDQAEITIPVPQEYQLDMLNVDKVPHRLVEIVAVYRSYLHEGPLEDLKYWYEFQGVRIA